MLQKEGIPHVKIWNFAPSRFTFISKKMLHVADPLELAPNKLIQWGYHVTTVVRCEEQFFAIDPGLFPESPVSIEVWLKAQNCNNSYYTLIDPQWYSFNSFNGLTVYKVDKKKRKIAEHQLPNWFPNVITGDFFSYGTVPQEQHWLEQGLAILDLGYQMYEEEIVKNKSKRKFKVVKTLLGKIGNLEATFKYRNLNQEITTQFLEKNKKMIRQYRKIYDANVEKWKELLTTYFE